MCQIVKVTPKKLWAEISNFTHSFVYFKGLVYVCFISVS
ncbi:hypothetical protein PI172_0618 [Prevotella intermedia]|uniref:Uncharacterized protein n=1 Tax=Prevotella intermedia TaxID=28131 RepID=A0AAD1F6W5_PREIN|nr:hypothetical protein PI172_0618 [Prevotella intermedia]